MLATADLLDAPLDELLAAAREQRRGEGLVTFSPKVFIPLTTLCRDVCGYCTFARPPRRGERAYLTEAEVLEIARAGAAAGCTEALFTLGDKPERRYAVARRELRALGCETTIEYLARVAGLVLEETGLLPHANPGVMTRAELELLRPVSASMGIMLETTAERLGAKGGPHWASPDKVPARRLETIALAGDLRIPFTSGILIGIGETRVERLDALRALAVLHERFGHLQEVIVQNFRAKPGTRMAAHAEPSLDEHLWTIAAARLLLPWDVSVQAPPNLAYDDFPRLLDAGIDDWGGVSPVTIDHVNPEAPWPERELLEAATRSAGSSSRRACPSIPASSAPSGSTRACCRRRCGRPTRSASPASTAGTRASAARCRSRYTPTRFRWTRGMGWGRRSSCASSAPAARSGSECSPPPTGCGARCAATRSATSSRGTSSTRTSATSAAASARSRRGGWRRTCAARPISCRSKRSCAARARRGSVEPRRSACRAASIPAFTGDYYADVVAAIRGAVPGLHVHAFSALEVWQGAATLGVGLEPYLARLRDLGLGSLPGTAAEILDDEVRAVICPDKVTTAQWLAVHEAAHRVGLRSNVTIMFGHVESPLNWVRHLLRAKEQQRRSGGFTEFVPLPFVHMEAPMWLQGRARSGPTFGETLLLHAVARLALHPEITNIQASWVKLGPARCGGGAARGRERPRRHAHERVDLPLGRRGARAGDATRGDGGADPGERSHPAPAHDPVRGRAGRAPCGVLRRRAARRAAQPPGAGCGAQAAPAARPAWASGRAGALERGYSGSVLGRAGG